MSEIKFKTKVLKYLKLTYPTAWVYHPSDKFVSGIPDILMLLEQKFYAIELKVHPNKITPIQEYTLKKISAAGGRTTVAYTLDEIKEVIK